MKEGRSAVGHLAEEIEGHEAAEDEQRVIDRRGRGSALLGRLTAPLKATV